MSDVIAEIESKYLEGFKKHFPKLKITANVKPSSLIKIANSIIIAAAIIYHIVKDMNKNPGQKYDEFKKQLAKAETEYLKSRKIWESFKKQEGLIKSSAVRAGFGGGMVLPYYQLHEKIVEEYIPKDLNMLLFTMQLKEKDFIELASKRPDFWRETGVPERILSLDDEKFGTVVLSMITIRHNRKEDLKLSAFFEIDKYLQILDLYPKEVKNRFVKLKNKYSQFYANVFAKQAKKEAFANVGGSPLVIE